MRKKVGKKLNLILSLFSVIVLLPLIVTILCQGMRLDHLMKKLPLEQGPPSGLSVAGTESAGDAGMRNVTGGDAPSGDAESAAGRELPAGDAEATGGKTSSGNQEQAAEKESFVGDPDRMGGEIPTGDPEQETAEEPSTGDPDRTGGEIPTGDPEIAAEVEEKLVGIVAREIRADSSVQAILAQCVIARTNLYDAMRTGTAEPEAFTGDELRDLWGENYERICQSFRECVEQTKGEVLTYQGQYIYAAYHAVSAGRTREMAELYAKVDMPYLSGCPCPEDTVAEGYLAVQYWEKEKFLENCGELFPESVPGSMDEIKIESRDSAGYVKEITVGDKSYTGEEFRARWKLNSACFAVTEDAGQVRIVTKGLGHGFGLSQHTAEMMAVQGKSYEEILSCFYPGTELWNLNGG